MDQQRDYEAVATPLGGGREDRMRQLADALWEAFAERGFSWVGFYTAEPGDEEMLLGPRRDKPACSPIGLHGMCGLAWRERRAVIVRDVRRLGEHYVACDPRDMSELVVPLLEPDGGCWGVLDVDSFDCDAFDVRDARDLSALVERAGLSAPIGDRAWPIIAGF